MRCEPIAVLGAPGLAEALLVAAPGLGLVRVESVAAAAGVGALVHLDEGDEPAALAAQREALAAGLPLLHARLTAGLATVGPWVFPGEAGCLRCSEARRRFVAAEPAGLRPLAAGVVPAPWRAAFLAVLAAHLAEPSAWAPRRIHALTGHDLAGRWHTVSPFPACPECGTLPDDSAARAVIAPRPRPQAEPAAFRLGPLALEPARLRAELLDWRYGLVSHVHQVSNAPLALTGTEHAVAAAPGEVEQGWGRARSFPEAETVAFLEVLERYASMAPRGKRTVVTGSLASLGEVALDPRSLGTPPPGSPLDRFTPALELRWVWAHSLRDDRPRLVPEQSVYYRVGAFAGDTRISHETSNGAALGACLEEAAFHGFLEIIERDGFLLAWHGRLPVPELVVDGREHRELGLLLDRAAARGYRVCFFDIGTELGVAAVWALALAETDDAPATFSAAAAHPDPVRAALGALRELVPNIYLHQGKHTDDDLRAMLADPTRVRDLDDHVALHTLPEARERFDFLFTPGRRRVPLREAYPGWREAWVRDDLGESLRLLVARAAARGLDTLVVDTTSPELERLGLCAVKVLVPGTLPMTFGHDGNRIHGLPRLLEAPVALGYWPAPRALAELPLHPHPFP